MSQTLRVGVWRDSQTIREQNDTGSPREAVTTSIYTAGPGLLNSLSVFFGILLVAGGLIDLLATVLWVNAGQGPITSEANRWGWRAALHFHDPESDRSHRFLGMVGPFLFLTTALIWYLLQVLGWALVFIPDAFSGSVDVWDRLWFSAATVLGQSPEGLQLSTGSWEAVSTVARFSGIGIASLGLAYVLPVVDAATQKRRLASAIHSVGQNPEEMIALEREAKGTGSLHLHMIAWVPDITLAAQRHLTYPVLNYMHSPTRFESLPIAVTTASGLLGQDLSSLRSEDPTVTNPLGRAISHLLDTVQPEFSDKGDESGPGGNGRDLPSNVPSEQRLRSYLHANGWSWNGDGW